VTNIFVSSDETKVIGGTANVNVEVDFGPKGDRGNLFLVGYGDPNTVSHSVTLQILDFYINVQATDEDYLVLYQYVNSGGVNTWVPTSKLMTDKFSVIRQVSFTNGTTTDPVDFKISQIAPLSLSSGLTEENYNIQCTFSHPSKPIAHSISVMPITVQSGTGDLVLPVAINAVEFSEGTWSGLHNGPGSEPYYIHFLITVV
jgi:hypothetical protein